MTQKRTYKRYPKELKEEVVSLVLDQGTPLLRLLNPFVVKGSLG